MDAGNRRKNPRIPLSHLAVAVGHDPDTAQQSTVMGVTADISEGGMQFQAEHGFKEGSEVQVAFCMGEAIIEAIGGVVYFTPGEGGAISMGIRFLHVSHHDKESIRRHCRNKGPKR